MLSAMLDFLTGYVMGGRAAARAASLAREAGAAAGVAVTHDIEDLEMRLERLLLVVESMWSLLRESGYNDDQLIARIKQLDIEDGTADGRRAAKPRQCPSCRSMVEPGRDSCPYCGKTLPPSEPLAGV
jgi:hypothetical protein